MSDQSHAKTKRAVQPEIPRSRFALGTAKYPRDMEELRLGRSSDGQRASATAAAGTAPWPLQ